MSGSQSAVPLEQCIAAIAQESDYHFDPSLVAVFVQIAEQRHRELAPRDEQALINHLFCAIPHRSPQELNTRSFASEQSPH